VRPAGPARAALLAVLRRTGAVRQISSFAACGHALPTSAGGATAHPGGRGCPPKLYTLAARAANEPRFDAAAYVRAVWR